MLKSGKAKPQPSRDSKKQLVCELQVRLTDLVKKLEKKARGITKYQNTIGQTPQDVLEAEPKKFLKVRPCM
jgi:hypothetical protein